MQPFNSLKRAAQLSMTALYTAIEQDANERSRVRMEREIDGLLAKVASMTAAAKIAFGITDARTGLNAAQICAPEYLEDEGIGLDNLSVAGSDGLDETEMDLKP